MRAALAALVLMGCAGPEETPQQLDGIYWSSTAGSVSATTEVVIVGVPGTGVAGETLVVTNQSNGNYGGLAPVGEDGSFVGGVRGRLEEVVELAYESVDGLPDGVSARLEIELDRDLEDQAPQTCGGCGAKWTAPDADGLAIPSQAELVAWQPPYVLYDPSTDAVVLWDEGDPGIAAESGVELCFFGVQFPGHGRTAIACDVVP